MNKIHNATIVDIQREGNTQLVKLKKGCCVFTVLMLHDGEDAVCINAKCNIIFKESEVVISSQETQSVSIRNRFTGRILTIEEDSILSRIFIDFNGIEITSLITKEAKDELKLSAGSKIEWLVKSNELMLELLD